MVKQVIEGNTFEVIFYGRTYEEAKQYGADHHHPLEFFVKQGEGVSRRLYQLWARPLIVHEATIHREDLQ